MALSEVYHYKRRMAAVALTAALLMVALFAFLARQQVRARQDLYERFQTRGEIGARFISAYLNDLAKKEAYLAGAWLSDENPTREAFEQSVQPFSFQAAVLLNSEGGLLQVYPRRDEIIGQNLAARYPHLNLATKGKVAVSNVVPSASEGLPVVAVATPYDTPFGRRVMSGAFPLGQSPLEPFLKNMIPFTSRVYLVDSKGQLAAAIAPGNKPLGTLTQQDPALARALQRTGKYYSDDGVEYAHTTAPVPGTALKVVLAAKRELIFKPLNQFGPPAWLLLGSFMTATLSALVLLNRLWQRQAQLRAQSLELETKLDEGHRLNRALDEFSSRVAHDLRNPLANIYSTTALTLEANQEGESGQEMTELAHAESQRGLDLIQGLLEMAKASGTPRMQDVDLEELAKKLCAEIPSVELKWKDLPTVTADRLALHQAFANLIQNAGLYGSNNGKATVELTAERGPRTWTISVEDRGPGVPVGDAETLFRPFERGHKQEISGTGLGLAIVAATAEAHGGTAWYEPREGGGSRFRFSIKQLQD